MSTPTRVGDAIPKFNETVGKYQSIYYAGASGDFNPLHIDNDFGKRVGFPGMILHGLCTMAFVVRAQTDWLSNPYDLKKLRLRFAKPVLPLDEITVTGMLKDRTERGAVIELEAKNQRGEVVVSNAFAEVMLPEEKEMRAEAPAAAVDLDAVTCKDIFLAMPARFIPAGAASWNTVIQFKISGPKGGEFNLVVQDQKCTAQEGVAQTPRATVIAKDEVWIGMTVKRTVDPQMAYMTGQLQIQGNMGDIMKLNNPNIFRRE